MVVIPDKFRAINRLTENNNYYRSFFIITEQ